MAKARTTEPESIGRSTPVEQCPPLQTNVRWPLPVDQRLNELLDLISAHGSEATRSQLLAALVANAPVDAANLDSLIRQYKHKTAGRIVLQPRGPIAVPQRKPGRRHR